MQIWKFRLAKIILKEKKNKTKLEDINYWISKLTIKQQNHILTASLPYMQLRRVYLFPI